MAQEQLDLIDPLHKGVFLQAAKHFGVYILVRAANPLAFRFYHQPGYFPKQLDVKAKTAKIDLPPYTLGGLVVNPHIHPAAFGNRDMQGVKKNWEDSLSAIYLPQPGQHRTYLPAGKRYAVEMDPAHKHYGALHLCKSGLMSHKLFICGDYDLYGLIAAKDPKLHEFVTEERLGAKHVRTPELTDVQTFLNSRFGFPLIQHGAQESYLSHQDEPIIAFEPSGTSTILPDKRAIEAYYATKLQGRQAFDSKHPEAAKAARGLWKKV
jgi:hypothetical protein